jgi:hypothetical protein
LQRLTQGLTPQQLNDVSAVARDVAREQYYNTLAAAGGVPKGGAKLATEAAKSVGVPTPALLSVPLTIFNTVVKRLAGKMDKKLEMELARELSNPALTAQIIEQAMAKMQPPPGGALRAAQKAIPGFSSVAPMVQQLAPQVGATLRPSTGATVNALRGGDNKNQNAFNR